jgi:alpha-glucoside transport system permease protein
MTTDAVITPPVIPLEVSPATGRATRRRWTGVASTLAKVAIWAMVVLWTIPTIGLFITSLRKEDVIYTSGWWTVLAAPFDLSQYTLENYRTVLQSEGMGNAFVNTITVTLPAVVIPLFIASFAAYAFSWIRFPGREPLFYVFVAMLVVPLQVAFIPNLRLFSELGINNTFVAAWLTHTGFCMPIALLILRNYIASLPHELIEAALVDGASHWTIYRRVVLPLSWPALAAFGVFHFLWVWNDFLVNLVFLGGGASVEVLTVNLQSLLTNRGQDFHLLAAGAFITMIVPVIVFLVLQRHFVRGLLAGSTKG